MSKQGKNAIMGLAVGGGVLLALTLIANNPRISPLWRNVARTAEGDVFQNIFTGELVTLF